MSYLETIKEIILMPKNLITEFFCWLWNECTTPQLVLIIAGLVALAIIMDHFDEWAFGSDILDGEYVVVPDSEEEKTVEVEE